MVQEVVGSLGALGSVGGSVGIDVAFARHADQRGRGGVDREGFQDIDFGVVIGAVVVLMYMPIFELAGNLQ